MELILCSKKYTFTALALVAAFAFGPAAQALELDWSGQFWSEFNYIHNYTLDSSANSADPARLVPTGAPATGQVPNGYYIPSGGSNNASFETLFLKLKPKVVVNDNIYIKSEFWLGDPAYSVFGGAYPYNTEQRQFLSTQSRGSTISAQRLWGEFLSDFGTLQVGRAPLNWGLGLFWNAGDSLFSRYESTGDVIRLISKFGAVTFSPAFVNYTTGNTFGGACAYSSALGLCQAQLGSGSVSDYSLMLKYESLEDDFEGGLNFVRRIIGGSQDSSGTIGPAGAGTAAAMSFNTWDLYAKKRLGRFTLSAEAPITSGSTGIPYSTFAVAGELDWKISDMWSSAVHAGHAPGQPNSSTGTFDTFKAYYFNPNYKIGTILFNYQLANLGGFPYPNTQNNPAAGTNQISPFDAPIVNANYLSWGGALHADKWTFNTNLLYAHASQSAQTGQFYYNTWQRKMSGAAAVKDQSGALGFEWDAGAKFQWDEFFEFHWDVGLFFPGAYYKFSNTTTDNRTDTLFASVWRIGVNF